MTPPAIAIFGPTAIGKTDLSLELANYFSSEIISVDSMQVYRHMDIGTAKPDRLTLEQIPHHLINICDPDEQFTAGMFIRSAAACIHEIIHRGHTPILAGGTGLYFCSLINGMIDIPRIDPEVKAKCIRRWERIGQEQMFRMLERLDPQFAVKIHENDSQRTIRALEVLIGTGKRFSWYQTQPNRKPEIPFIKIGLTMKRSDLYERINKRVELMVSQGLFDEVEHLLKMGYTENDPGLMAIGYRESVRHLRGEETLEKTIMSIKQNSRRYAKRQITWFKKVRNVTWFEKDKTGEIAPFIEQKMKKIMDTRG
jgi:tRNA dimethylallyltransferase